jgi:hypothetical protein
MLKARNVNATPRRLIIPGVATVGLLGIYLYSRPSKTNETEGSDHIGNRARAKKDSDGLQGAGVGGNFQSGGHETGAKPPGQDSERKVQTTADSLDKLPSGGVGGGVGAGGANVRAMAMEPSGSYNEDSKIKQGVSAARSMLKGGEDTSHDSGASSLPSRAGANHDGSSNNYGGASQEQDVNTKTLSRGYPTGTEYPRGSSESNSNAKMSASQRLQGAFQQGGRAAGEPGENQRKYHDTRVHSNLPGSETPTKRF